MQPTKNPILDLPLTQVLRPEIALPLQHLLQIYTVGNFLGAWRSPKRQRSIEQLFEHPAQARHAAQVCAHWVGLRDASLLPVMPDVTSWWREEPRAVDPMAA